MTEDELIDLEIAYAVQHHDSYRCNNLHDPVTLCCRHRGHKGPHAAGWGTNRRRWSV